MEKLEWYSWKRNKEANIDTIKKSLYNISEKIEIENSVALFFKLNIPRNKYGSIFMLLPDENSPVTMMVLLNSAVNSQHWKKTPSLLFSYGKKMSKR